MSCAARDAASRRLAHLLRSRANARSSSFNYESAHTKSLTSSSQSQYRTPTSYQQYRQVSSSSTSPSKPIVLEKPDQFRPPSHASRLNARSTTSMYGGGAAYNQQRTDKERHEAGKKRYPNMFPEEGTRMHWFLTNRFVHVVISLVSTIYRHEQLTALVKEWR